MSQIKTVKLKASQISDPKNQAGIRNDHPKASDYCPVVVHFECLARCIGEKSNACRSQDDG